MISVLRLIFRFTLYVLFTVIVSLIVIYVVPSGNNYKISDHYNGSVFSNIGKSSASSAGFIDVLKWQMSSKPQEWVKLYDHNYDIPPETVKGNNARISYVGHLTFLIQVHGTNMLVDPIWSERAGPFGIFGPKRFTIPGIEFEKLPKIDVVMITHNHYDHLDIPTLKMLHTAHDPIFIMPLGNAHLIRMHIPYAKIRELDWWDAYEIEKSYHVNNKTPQKISINLVPSHHWSARTLFDKNEALWGSYVISLPKNKQICILGDTAYDKDIFTKIADKFRNIQLSIIPIGAYLPEFIMKHAHMSPEEAAQAHIDLKSKFSIPSHYGTFRLSDESNVTQINDFKSAIKKHGVDKSFQELKVGNYIMLDLDRSKIN